MKGIVASLLGMFVMACSGCGGGGGGSAPAATSQVVAPVVQKPVLIDAEGDSLIWGYQGVNASGQMIQSVNAPPVVLQATLQSQLAGSVMVQNNAVPGATVSESLTGNMPYTVPFSTRLMNVQARIVLADYAANDAAKSTVDQYKTDLSTWITTVRNMGKIPVLEEPNPVCDPKATNVPAFRAAMDAVAQAQGVLLIQQYDYVTSLPNWQGMLVDCVHPNDALYALKAQREAAALAPLVKSLQ